MTYCVAIKLNEGLVCLSDTRTNAGLDNIAKYRKMFTWHVPDDRVIVMMTSGNLAITQAIISQIQESLEHPKQGIETIFTAPTIFRVAEVVGTYMQNFQAQFGPGLAASGQGADASVVIAGQRKGGELRLFMVYSAGNFIEATDDTPFFQIGEHKYGKPILDRVITPETSLEDGVICALLSMDSTLRSNLSVGMPLDLAVFRRDRFEFEELRRIEEDNESFRELSLAWSNALRQAFSDMRKITRLSALGPEPQLDFAPHTGRVREATAAPAPRAALPTQAVQAASEAQAQVVASDPGAAGEQGQGQDGYQQFPSG